MGGDQGEKTSSWCSQVTTPRKKVLISRLICGCTSTTCKCPSNHYLKSVSTHFLQAFRAYQSGVLLAPSGEFTLQCLTTQPSWALCPWCAWRHASLHKLLNLNIFLTDRMVEGGGVQVTGPFKALQILSAQWPEPFPCDYARRCLCEFLKCKT